MDKIAERCKQATESLSSDRSRENAEAPTPRAMPSYEVIVVGLGAVGSAATWRLARLEENAPAPGQPRDAQVITESGGHTALLVFEQS